MQVLFVTVGGSSQPVVTAVRTLEPERVVFICSRGSKGSESQVVGEGTPCEVRRGGVVVEQLPNIPTQLQLGERFVRERDLVLLDDPDELGSCYEAVAAKVKEVAQQVPSKQLGADYSGGTKTMSLALALVALDYAFPLYLTTGMRTDLVRVTHGELTGQVGISSLAVRRFLDRTLPGLLQGYDYAAARTELRRLLASGELTASTKRQVQQASDYCAGFDAWDRFNHREALSFLGPYMSDPTIQPLGIFLRAVIGCRAAMDSGFSQEGGRRGHGYELVADLIRNAERRAVQGRHDDAVGRLYRALELLAQIRLKRAYDIITGDVALEKLPDGVRPSYEAKRKANSGRIELGLMESYALLATLGDALGKVFAPREKALKDALKIRNHSLFAHGFQPISAQEYDRCLTLVLPFLEEGLSACGASLQAPQFPTSF